MLDVSLTNATTTTTAAVTSTEKKSSDSSSSSDFATTLSAALTSTTATTDAKATDSTTVTSATDTTTAIGTAATNTTSTKTIATDKPCIAQFMVMTGCDFDTASSALYQYNNWKQYFSNADTTIPDLETAQIQLQNEVSAGGRAETSGIYGARTDYTEPTILEPETIGKVVPVFNEISGTISGVGFIGQDNKKYTTSSLSDKDEIKKNAIGFGLGSKSLDNFAILVNGEGSTWDSLDLNSVTKKFLTQTQYEQKYGTNTEWNPKTAPWLLGTT